MKKLINPSLLVCVLALFGIIQSSAEIPPNAEVAVKNGVMAFKETNYLLAISYFQEARKIAPDAPEIYFKLGVAESKIPGRELRAICWLGAYLAGTPNAANASKVINQITQLNEASHSKLLRMIQMVETAAEEKPFLAGQYRRDNLLILADLWLSRKNYEKALKINNLIEDEKLRQGFRVTILTRQATDLADENEIEKACAVASLLSPTSNRCHALCLIAEHQIKSGDFDGAKTTYANALLIGSGHEDQSVRLQTQFRVAQSQANSYLIEDAQQTVDLISDDTWKEKAQASINKVKGEDFKRCNVIWEMAKHKAAKGDYAEAKKLFALALSLATVRQNELIMHYTVEAQASVFLIEDAQRTVDSMPEGSWKESSQELVNKAKLLKQENPEAKYREPTPAETTPFTELTASVWLQSIDDKNWLSRCALGMDFFSDPTAAIQSSSQDPYRKFDRLIHLCSCFNDAQKTIDEMLNTRAAAK